MPQSCNMTVMQNQLRVHLHVMADAVSIASDAVPRATGLAVQFGLARYNMSHSVM